MSDPVSRFPIQPDFIEKAAASQESAEYFDLSGRKAKDSFYLASEFRRLLTIERKRCDRSGNAIIVCLITLPNPENVNAAREVFNGLSVTLRETDLIGWYKTGRVIGAILTDIELDSRLSAADAVREKLEHSLDGVLGEASGQDRLATHIYPEIEGQQDSAFDEIFYPEIGPTQAQDRADDSIKRAIDILGSVTLLILLSPLFLLIAAAIKINSPGPVLFRQERLGQIGKRFVFLKFRSMYTEVDSRVHEEFVRQFIASSREDGSRQTPNGGDAHEHETPLYKLTNDCRVTTVGRFLRKTSLDELPQFWNVLQGHLSLVGPRPPIPYELSDYAAWHRRRLLETKPGITGLWQVTGRSRTTFDEMVRLDLRYARMQSLRLDLLILLKTPWAVLKGDGAC